VSICLYWKCFYLLSSMRGHWPSASALLCFWFLLASLYNLSPVRSKACISHSVAHSSKSSHRLWVVTVFDTEPNVEPHFLSFCTSPPHAGMNSHFLVFRRQSDHIPYPDSAQSEHNSVAPHSPSRPPELGTFSSWFVESPISLERSFLHTVQVKPELASPENLSGLVSVAPKREGASEPPEGLLNFSVRGPAHRASASSRLGWGLRMCISYKLRCCPRE